MEKKPMKILIVEDDVVDCNNFINAVKNREDIEIIGMTDSDIEAIKLVKTKHPEGIILDLELNNSKSGSTDSFEFLTNLKKLKLSIEPIVIVTTHVNSKRTYEILHRNGVDLILYKDQPNYSSNHVLNQLINLKISPVEYSTESVEDLLKDEDETISELINKELELVGVNSKLKGREYIHDAIKFLIKEENSNISVIQYLTNLYKKPASTITNGIQNAIIHAWRVSSVDDLLKYYTCTINHDTGVPTPMEFVYYYRDKIKKML